MHPGEFCKDLASKKYTGLIHQVMWRLSRPFGTVLGFPRCVLSEGVCYHIAPRHFQPLGSTRLDEVAVIMFSLCSEEGPGI